MECAAPQGSAEAGQDQGARQASGLSPGTAKASSLGTGACQATGLKPGAYPAWAVPSLREDPQPGDHSHGGPGGPEDWCCHKTEEEGEEQE